MTALDAFGIVVANSVGPDPVTFAVSIAYADSNGEPGDTVSYGEFFTLFDATQFAVTQAWLFSITRGREHVAATIMRGGPLDSGTQILAAAGTATEISDAVGQLLMDQAGAR